MNKGLKMKLLWLFGHRSCQKRTRTAQHQTQQEKIEQERRQAQQEKIEQERRDLSEALRYLLVAIYEFNQKDTSISSGECGGWDPVAWVSLKINGVWVYTVCQRPNHSHYVDCANGNSRSSFGVYDDKDFGWLVSLYDSLKYKSPTGNLKDPVFPNMQSTAWPSYQMRVFTYLNQFLPVNLRNQYGR